MSRVLILGAGASKGTLGEKAPTSAEFGAYLECNMKAWKEDHPYLKSAVEFFSRRLPKTSLNSWSLNEVWGAIDNRVKLRSILRLQIPGAPLSPPKNRNIYRKPSSPWCLSGPRLKQDHFGPAGFELRSLVTRVYGQTLSQEISKAVLRDGSLKRELKGLRDGDSIISFNYDLLAEEMLKSIHRPQHARAISLCKPHGSVSWKIYDPECAHRKTRILQKAVLDQENDYYPCDNVEVQTGIVEPIPYKSRLISPEIQGSIPSFSRILVKQWKTLIRKISKAEEIIMMGYAFPKEDLHAQYMFAEAVASRGTNRRLRIRVYQFSMENFMCVRRNLINIFGDVDVEFMGDVKP